MSEGSKQGSNNYDFLVLGAGPAGLQLGYFLEKHAKSHNTTYMIFEREAEAAPFFNLYPRSDMLISINKVYTGTDDFEFNMRHDWNSLAVEEEEARASPELLFKHFTEDIFPHREHLPRYLQTFAQKNALRIQYNTEVVKVARNAEKLFVLTDANGNTYTCKYLWVATGTVSPYIPDIPGIEKAWLYSEFPLEKEHWKNKRVLILGKGNSAFETADALTPWCSTIHLCSPNPVKLAWDSHYVGNLRAVNNNYLDLYQLKSQHGMISGRVLDLKWDEGNENSEKGRGVTVTYDFTVSPDDPVTSFHYDEVIVCTGWNYFKPELFDETCKVSSILAGKFSDLTPLWESTSQPNLFFAGTGMGGKEFKKFTTGFIHGFRYCIRSQLNVVLNREFGNPLKSDVVTNSVQALTDHIVKRVNRCAGPYQMFEVLVDAIALPPLGTSDIPENLNYYHELPRGYVNSIPEFRDAPYIEIVLQYGDRGNVPAFMFEQQSVPGKADLGWALHPCLRCFYKGKLISRHHMLETAELNWDIPKYHNEPLKEWLTNLFAILQSTPEEELPALKNEAPLASLTVVYRGSEGEEHVTKLGGQMTKGKMMGEMMEYCY